MKNRIALIICLLFTALLKAQTGVSIDNFIKVDDQITDFMKTWNIPGSEVAITKNGKLIYNKGFGYSDQKKTKLATPNNLYRIASVSKSITSIAIMKLIQDGKLSLTDTVFGIDKILDQPYYLRAITDKKIYSITIQNLLEHTAGWDRDIPCDGYDYNDPPFFPQHVAEEMGEANPVGDSTLIKFSLKKGISHIPGATFSYSNIGYLVLGKVIEKITGMHYEVYVQKNIFDPLSICDIHLGKNLLKNGLEREAEYNNSYTTTSCYGDGKIVPWQYGGFNIEAMNAHGGWVATASDLTKLMLAVDGSGSSPDILDRSTIDMMRTGGSAYSGYAKGWFVNNENSWHTGSLDGTATFICSTGSGYTWAFLFNARSDNGSAFWNAFDQLPWNCMETIENFPAINLYPPTKNVSNISANVLSSGSLHLTWTNGNGNRRIILATERSSLSNYPIDGNNYTANVPYRGETDLGNETIVVYDGTGNNATITNLDPSKTYLITGFEYYKNKDTGYNEVYKLSNNEHLYISPDPEIVQRTNSASVMNLTPNP